MGSGGTRRMGAPDQKLVVRTENTRVTGSDDMLELSALHSAGNPCW